VAPTSASETENPPPPDEELAQVLAELGVETETERTVKRVAPWVVSALFHVGIILLVLLIAGTAVLLRQEEEPVLIVADFDMMSYDPIMRLERDPAPKTDPLVQELVDVEAFEPQINEQLVEVDVDPHSIISDAASRSAMARFAPEPTEATAQFVGISTTNAHRIVYVIDASGSMIPYLRRIIQELARSLDALAPPQEFGIIFFQGDQATVVPPQRSLALATPEAKLKALEWIDDNIVAQGGTYPPAAIEKAMSLSPDVIFLLSQDIRGYGRFEVDQQELLDIFDQFNPADPNTGRRSVVINCIQFVYEDELQTMRKIAEQHGGPRGYKFLNKEELGL
jgi:hypothetical protein